MCLKQDIWKKLIIKKVTKSPPNFKYIFHPVIFINKKSFFKFIEYIMYLIYIIDQIH